MRSLVFASALLLAVALLQPQTVHAHATLEVPVSRSYASNLLGETFCPHCGQGKGGFPGICGDPFQTLGTPTLIDPTNYFVSRFYGIKGRIPGISLNTV
ncbi:hypothetical protein FOA52_008775 [Chlamydomonas sp. UWO 241]|nr:hypothetical protein FOA52_008775 [Chlamydomonas sp. UWO 241]